jgi:hypothetical protein
MEVGGDDTHAVRSKKIAMMMYFMRHPDPARCGTRGFTAASSWMISSRFSVASTRERMIVNLVTARYSNRDYKVRA